MKLLTSTLLLAALALAGSESSSAQSGTARSLGPVTAAVRIDVFSDYECPACKALHEQTLKRIKEGSGSKTIPTVEAFLIWSCVH